MYLGERWLRPIDDAVVNVLKDRNILYEAGLMEAAAERVRADAGLSGFCCADCAAGGSCASGLSGMGLNIADIPDELTFVDPDTNTTSGGVGHSLLDASLKAFQSGDPISGALTVAATAASFIPGVGPIASGVIQLGSQFMGNLAHWLSLGAGRKEADMITSGPNGNIQDAVFRRIQDIAAEGLNSVNIKTLQNDVIELQQLRSLWLTFLSNTSHFTDGRASTQAADSIMPYLDGTCGYHWPPPLRPDYSSGCGTTHPTPFGNAWPGDWGYGAGLLGALTRRLIDLGGQVIMYPTQGAGVPSLRPAIPGLPAIPQAGYLPPVSPLSPIRAGLIPDISGSSNLVPIAIGGLALLMLSRRAS